jgi:tetratricopeptide (TPR) repeat protein
VSNNAEQGLANAPQGQEDPRTMALLADIILSAYLNSWNEEMGLKRSERELQVDRAQKLAEEAIKRDGTIALAHYSLGFVYRMRGDHPSALNKFEDAIKADYNFAAAYAQKANELVFNGRPKEAIEPGKEAIDRSPLDQSIGVFYFIVGRAYFVMGEYQKAAEWLDKAVEKRGNLYFLQSYRVAAYALSGQVAKAQEEGGSFRKFSRYTPALRSGTSIVMNNIVR